MGGSLVAPSFGSGFDLRGALPFLPSPALGLVPLNGGAPEAAAALPEGVAARVNPSPATALTSGAVDKTPSLPGKPGGGAALPALSRDRAAADSAPENGRPLSGVPGEKSSGRPFADPAVSKGSHPEKTAGIGRRFFDQSADRDRGVLADAAQDRSLSGAATMPIGAPSGLGQGSVGRLSPNAGTGFGVGLVAGRGRVSGSSTRGETFRDAVASPGGAGPNGDRAFWRGGLLNNAAGLAASAGAPAIAVVPSLALDLSQSGLIVRVRSALNEVLSAPAPAPSSEASARLAAPGPSTALLERGAMLEAFSVARAYADSVPAVRSSEVGAPRQAAPASPLAPISESSAPSLWWAWLLLPFLIAALRVFP